MCWAEKADNYSAQCRTAASGNEDRARTSGESKIIVYFALLRHLLLAKARTYNIFDSNTEKHGDNVSLVQQDITMPTSHKNKTLATFLALALGFVGGHRFYLRGPHDRLGLLHVCSLPVAGIVYGAGHIPNVFWILLPVFLSAIVGYVEALVIGVMPDERWDARHNPGSGRVSHSNWLVALLLVVTMLVGTTVLIGTISRLFDLIFTGGAYG